jgi:hypothetical protein
MRGHDRSTVMVFDDCYMSFLWQAKLLVVANLVARGMPVFNTTTITVMVDRWRSQTHSFHLSCGEMTMTLEDVAMILGLSIRGRPITGRCDSSTWRNRVAAFLGRESPVKVLGVKG